MIFTLTKRDFVEVYFEMFSVGCEPQFVMCVGSPSLVLLILSWYHTCRPDQPTEESTGTNKILIVGAINSDLISGLWEKDLFQLVDGAPPSIGLISLSPWYFEFYKY